MSGSFEVLAALNDACPVRPFRISLWDLDNCLADDGWRSPLIEWDKEGNARYDIYDAEMSKDQVAHFKEWSIITALSHPVFFTGRRERWRKQTSEWIINHLPLFRNGRWERQKDPVIFMRGDTDNGKPVIVKELMLQKLLSVVDKSEIIAAFDDVQSIVDMYVKHGIPAVVLNMHDTRCTYGPKDL